MKMMALVLVGDTERPHVWDHSVIRSRASCRQDTASGRLPHVISIEGAVDILGEGGK